MPKIEIADDAGNEISEISIPIPFYIRVKMEEGMKRYRISLIDDFGKIRSQYTGGTERKYLELHIPLIRLSKPGQLRILIEESSGEASYSQKHQVSIHYLPYSLSERKPNIEDLSEQSEIMSTSEMINLQENSEIKKDQENKFSVSDQIIAEFNEEGIEKEQIVEEQLEILPKKHENANEGISNIVKVETDKEKIGEGDNAEKKNISSLEEVQKEKYFGISLEEAEYLFKREEIIKHGAVQKRSSNIEEE